MLPSVYIKQNIGWCPQKNISATSCVPYVCLTWNARFPIKSARLNIPSPDAWKKMYDSKRITANSKTFCYNIQAFCRRASISLQRVY